MDIWEACHGAHHIGALQISVYRVVESQARAATLDLVDTLAEQALLEELIEQTKPALPPTVMRLPYLLQSPFRYPPLRHGSRFGGREVGGMFYASLNINTALAETAYYRFVFLTGMSSPPAGGVNTDLSSFRVGIRATHAVCLDIPPFDVYVDAISSRSTYTTAQHLGDAMRREGVEVARYISARGPKHGRNLVVFSPGVFSGTPRDLRSWRCTTTADRVVFVAAHHDEGLQFEREIFEVDGHLPAPAP